MSSNSPDPQNSKALLVRKVCYDCCMPIEESDDTTLVCCPRCGSTDITGRSSRPTSYFPPDTVEPLPFPWNRLNLEPGGTVLLSGDAGSGKTTCTLKLLPTRFCSSEQENEKVFNAWKRIVGDKLPRAKVPVFSVVSNWDELDEDLRGLGPDDIVVVDSISQLAAGENAGRIIKTCIERIQQAHAKGVFIAQYTKAGEMLGPNELRHLVDVVAQIPNDNTGLRRLAFDKNRFGSLSSTYFRITNEGLVPQGFDFAYSVEGAAGNYRLQMYPMTGKVQYATLLKDLEDAGVRVRNCACAAISCGLYPTGYAEPPDVQERVRFAHKHGLVWIGPEAASDMRANPSASFDLLEELRSEQAHLIRDQFE